MLLLALICCPRPVSAQGITTPLEQEILTLLTNEISGQMIFNNEVMLAGAPWVREEGELTDTFYESQRIYDLVRSYGIETTRFVRHSSDRTFEYPLEGEFWIEEPQKRLVARIGADAALVARGSVTADVTGRLIYIPPLGSEEIDAMIAGESGNAYRGKIAIMWSHARGRIAEALDEAGVQAVISFGSRDRYLDPNQVVYSSGSYGMENLRLGFTVSWRQWSELLEDMEANREITVRCMARVEEYPDRFETIYSWIPGTEPDEKGVVFTAHLFEGYTKRGANDNMSGCVIQLEILRALSKLIADGTLPQPRRTIHFLWPNEISGTYEFIKQTPGFAERLSNNINMDMVGEALRMNNSWFTMSECPNHLPNYIDGLATSMMNYVWRTNDIVYLPGAPRGRPGGQYFPVPMMEKNGSLDAFRFFVHQATGGSDHLCFNNASVAIPGIEFFTWPDQWYHADTDTPDKSDPTQMKRVAFIGAASAWAAVNCTDDVLDGLVDVTSSFGYSRIAERELPRAFGYIEAATADDLGAAMARAVNLVRFAAQREIEALESIEDMYSGSVEATRLVRERIIQWYRYKYSLTDLMVEFAGVRAEGLGVSAPRQARQTRLEQEYSRIMPALHPDVAAKEFSLNSFGPYREYLETNPDALREIDFGSNAAARFVLNYLNGERSITLIRDSVAAETGSDISLEAIFDYLELLKEVGWVDW